MINFLKLIRVKQYLKNFFIFIPIFFGLKILDTNLLLKSVYAFFAFSLITSSIYIFNDYNDIEEDKKHPEKCKRPLASGKISLKVAIIVMIVFFISGMVASYFLKIIPIVLFYFIMNIFYSIKLKHIPIFDITIIALGFVIRIFVGGSVSNIELTDWIVMITFLLSLFIAIAKRRDDIIYFLKTGETTRKVISGYNLDFINASMAISATIVIISYAMYTTSEVAIKQFNSKHLYTTTIFVIFGILRYLQLTLVEEKSGAPTDILIQDRCLQGVVLLWSLTVGYFIYF